MTNAEKLLKLVQERGGEWINVVDVLQVTGMTTRELKAAAEELLSEYKTFAAEPEPFGHRITAEMSRVAPEIGEEQRHKFVWQTWG